MESWTSFGPSPAYASPMYSGAQSPQAYTPYAQPYGAVVVYGSWGYPTTPTPTRQTNPFTPGLSPLPAVPSPTTFVSKDERAEKFPATTRADAEARNRGEGDADPLAWVTCALFSEELDKVERKTAVNQVPLQQLKAYSGAQPGTTHAVVMQDVKLPAGGQQPILLHRPA